VALDLHRVGRVDLGGRGLARADGVVAGVDAAAEVRVNAVDARVEERDRDAAAVEAGQ
jgi:hypothetical protein